VKHLSWIVTVPLAVVIVVFAIANRQVVTIDLWPFDASLSGPLYLLILICLLVGFLAGATIMWLSEGRRRRLAREARDRSLELERQMTDLKRKVADRPAAPGATLPAATQHR